MISNGRLLNLPEADDVARIIVAAAAEVGVDPLDVAGGKRGFVEGGGASPLTRARGYAALALDQIFGCGALAIGRMVGAGSPAVYFTQLKQRAARAELKWFDRRVLARVITSAGYDARVSDREILKPKVTTTPHSVSPSRPIKVFDRDGPPPGSPTEKQRLRDMLRQAVENTAKIQRD